ncbi:MAG: ROK family protein [Aliishimia sp.]
MKPDTPLIKRPHLHDIRTQNRSRILQVLRERDLVSRQELAEILDLTPASLSRISRELIAQGICVDAPISRDGSQRGRPSVALKINAMGGFLVAISISSFSRLISIVDISGQQHHQQEIPKSVISSAPETVAFIGDFVDKLVAKRLLDRSLIIGASLTLPGSINVKSGFLTKSILLHWPNFPIKERLIERLQCPTRIENNGDALCRHFLDVHPCNEQHSSNVFLAHVSEGMGASIAIGDRIVRRLADEGWINDISVPSNPADKQSKRKLSLLASGRAILTNLLDANIPTQKGETEFSAKLEAAVTMANKTSEETRDVFFEAGQALGANLVALTIAIAPDAIVLAGPVLKAQAYAEGVRTSYEKVAEEMDIQPSRIVVSDASYIEASENLALHDFFFSGGYVT